MENKNIYRRHKNNSAIVCYVHAGFIIKDNKFKRNKG